jgi:large subunit ribosomal protein L7Ae
MTFEVPKEMADQTYQAIEVVRDTGKLRKGVNETTKAVEREKAILVVIAADVDPREVVMHLPLLCDEKDIAYTYVPSRKELGDAAGIGVSTASLAIVDVGDAKKLIEEIKKKAKQLLMKK